MADWGPAPAPRNFADSHRVQDAAGHRDPRTTRRYDRARGALDNHATYVVATYFT
jgi:hypothetical protein